MPVMVSAPPVLAVVTDVVLLEVECHAAEAAGEDNHLPGLDVGKTVDAGDTISDGDDRSSLGVLDGGVLRASAGNFGFKVGGEFESLGGQGSCGKEGGARHLR